MKNIRIKPIAVGESIAHFLTIEGVKDIVLNESAKIFGYLSSAIITSGKITKNIEVFGSEANEDGSQKTKEVEEIAEAYTPADKLTDFELDFIEYKNWEDDRNVIRWVCQQLETEQL